MISHLPDDLESEILSRVPAKSLAKLKTTCKRWGNLFKDPKFIKKNQSAREVLLLMSSRVYSICVDLHGIHNGIDPSMEFNSTLNTLNDSEHVKISEIYHCDGLMLCRTKGNTNSSIIVWNPCTGETRWIKPRNREKNYGLFALGYGSSRCYKVLRFCSYRGKDNLLVSSEFEMYDLSSDSWKVLDGFKDDWLISSNGVSLKGNTYWVAYDRETGFFFLKFDFTTERFDSLSLPYQSHNYEDTALLSVVNDERLSVLYQDILAFSNVMKIWVTNGIVGSKDMSWSKFLVVDYDKFELPSVSNVRSFLLDEEKKVAVCCDGDRDYQNMEGREKTRVYIVGEDIFKEVYKETTNDSLLKWSVLVSYVPSLVQIQKNTLKRQKKRKQKEEGTGSHLPKKR